MPECAASLSLPGQPVSFVRLNFSDLAVWRRPYQAGRGRGCQKRTIARRPVGPAMDRGKERGAGCKTRKIRRWPCGRKARAGVDRAGRTSPCENRGVRLPFATWRPKRTAVRSTRETTAIMALLLLVLASLGQAPRAMPIVPPQPAVRLLAVGADHAQGMLINCTVGFPRRGSRSVPAYGGGCSWDQSVPSTDASGDGPALWRGDRCVLGGEPQCSGLGLERQLHARAFSLPERSPG